MLTFLSDVVNNCDISLKDYVRDNPSLIAAKNDSVKIIMSSQDNNHSLMDRKRHVGQTPLLRAVGWNHYLPNMKHQQIWDDLID